MTNIAKTIKTKKIMSEAIKESILKIFSTGELLSFHTIQSQIQLSKRSLHRRLTILVKEGKIKKYRSLQDARIFHYKKTGD